MRQATFTRRMALATMAGLAVAWAAWTGATTERTADRMVRAAAAFVESLSPSQRQKALFEFDDPERLNWHFIPRARRGLSLKEMTDQQRRAAHELLHAGLSDVGYESAITIMALEAVLHELEKGGRFTRDPELYYWSIFGTPGRDTRWGWRVEGHHLSLNFVVDSGKVVSATPMFFGANPALVTTDTKTSVAKGTRTLAQEELLARQLVKSFSKEQLQTAVISRVPPRDVRGANAPQPPIGPPAGLPAANMTDTQRQLLWQLIQTYAGKMPAEIASEWLKQIDRSGLEKVHFAWAGGFEQGQPHYYRIQGPDFLVEYANVQPDPLGNPANHIHSVWRSLHGDFGLPLRR